MKFYHLDGRIDTQQYRNLIDFLNENNVHQKYISMDSTGGEEAAGLLILNALNLQSDSIQLVCGSGVYSMAFEIFHKFNGKKCLTTSSKGMVHKSSYSYKVDISGKLVYWEDICIKQMQKDKLKEGDNIVSLLTAKELKGYNRGDEIYFTFNRMKEIFPNATIIG